MNSLVLAILLAVPSFAVFVGFVLRASRTDPKARKWRRAEEE